ncbi:MAG: cytochrome c biogenesis protein CcsA [Candidatus Zixiibacteriota bacterium]
MALISGFSFLATALGKKNLFQLAKNAFFVQMALVIIAVAYLWYLFFSHDYSIKYVYEYSSNDLPFFYLVSSLWAGQDGTYLLWLFFSSIFGLIIIRRAKQYTNWGMVFFTLVNAFLFAMLLTLSPFRQLTTVPADGAGLNALLQDPWMVIHPPIIFVAFAMSGILFSIIMAAVVRKDYSYWLQLIFPYIGITALALALANVLGGYWAYKTLGWGGYWAWDPVENTSFIPWVVSLGAIHGMIIEKRIGALRRTNMLIGISIFLLAIYGTFLTRSGVLADFSVHSFVDLGANAVLITFVIFYFVLTAGLFLLNRHKDRIGQPMNYDIFSKDFFLMIGMILLLLLGLIVLFWSSLPFLTTYLTSTPRAAEQSTYNTFAIPFAILLSLFLTLWAFISIDNHRLEKLKSRALAFGAISLILAIILIVIKLATVSIAVSFFIYLTAFLLYFSISSQKKNLGIVLLAGTATLIVAAILGVKDFQSLFFFFTAGSTIGAQGILIISFVPEKIGRAGAHIAHFGYGFMLIGILASSSFGTNVQLSLPLEQAGQAYGYDITYHGMAGSLEEKNNELIVTMKSGTENIDARPQFFYTKRMDGIMKRHYIKKGLLYDLYLSPQDIKEEDHNHGLILRKGENAKINDYDIKFIGFDMGAHNASSSGMTVGVKLEVTRGDSTETIMPLMLSEGGQMTPKEVPLFSGSEYKIKVERIDATVGAVSITIPGLIESGLAERLVLDISQKPGINLLWLGTILVFLGNFIAIRKRLRAIV